MSRFRVARQQKLLAFLRDELQGKVSVKEIKRAIDEKRCLVNGRIERISTRILSPNDQVEIELLSRKRSFTFPILYEDEWLLIVDKPAGALSEKIKIGRTILVHRLDKETSGALILAKSLEAKEKMVELFRQKAIEKTYYALVDGEVRSKKGRVQNFLVKKRIQHGQPIWGSSKTGRPGELALTLWECLEKGKNASLLLCQPITGRTHQLRVHLSEMGHPILGDLQYGKNFTCPLKARRQLLHAFSLHFRHPYTEKEIEIKAPLPEDFLQAAKELHLWKS